jgi:MSHA biogenesis protein MshK
MSASSNVIQLCCAALLACAVAPALAQTLSDPTRPPAGLGLQGVPIGGEAAGLGLSLQSIRISAESRSAMINGEHVQIGQRVGGLRLIRVSESEVVVLEGGQRRTLKLYPGVNKKPVAIAPEAKSVHPAQPDRPTARNDE